VAPHGLKRAERIRVPPIDRAAILGPQRLGHDEQAEQEVAEGQRGAHHEWQAEIGFAE
jgi:hypothetical protein